jgi:uncharacterized Ntn-hydrolase superfamily protein
VTYSIVARDPVSGEMGVGVQSHWFSVGSVVTWGRAGVGAVATQSFAEPAYGPQLLDRIEAGEEAAVALAAEVEADGGGHARQVAVVDRAGDTAVHTGPGCIQHAGHVQGAGFSVQANMMATEGVWPAMAATFEAEEGPLIRRLLATLESAEGAGGDVRGRQSAALLVVPAEGEPWRNVAELRVEDHPEPLAELRRLVDLEEAYELMNQADEFSRLGRYEEAATAFMRAARLAPDNTELLFWGGLGMALQGDIEGGVALVRRAIDEHAGWADLLDRLEPEVAPSAAGVREALSR